MDQSSAGEELSFQKSPPHQQAKNLQQEQFS